MKMRSANGEKVWLGALFTALCTQQVLATEGGIGRPITGMQVQPLNGLLPVEEGGV